METLPSDSIEKDKVSDVIGAQPGLGHSREGKPNEWRHQGRMSIVSMAEEPVCFSGLKTPAGGGRERV